MYPGSLEGRLSPLPCSDFHKFVLAALKLPWTFQQTWGLWKILLADHSKQVSPNFSQKSSIVIFDWVLNTPLGLGKPSRIYRFTSSKLWINYLPNSSRYVPNALKFPYSWEIELILIRVPYIVFNTIRLGL